MSAVVYSEVAPGAELRGVVRCYWSIEGIIPEGTGVLNRVLPDGCMDVIFNLGEAPTGEIGPLPEPGYVVGTMPEAIVVGMVGRVEMVGVRFHPGGAGAYLNVPAPELTARSIGFSDIRREAGEVVERVALAGEAAGVRAVAGLSGASAVPDETVAVGSSAAGLSAGAARVAAARLRARAALLDGLIAGARPLAPDPMVAAAVRLIEASNGTIPVRELEHRLGVSPRTLTRRFTAAVGITPKVACRVARLQAAAAAIRAEPSASLARIAIRTGFHDQPHLNRDFAALARVTPARFAREAAGGFIQDATGIDD